MPVNFDSYSFFDGNDMTPVTQVTWADYWRGVIPDGVVANVAEEMKPYANSTGMYVYVAPGACIADNHRGVVSATKQLAVSAAHATKPRIDLLVARVVYGNANASYMTLDIKKGTAATNPVAPTLVQSTGSTYEIKLAEIYVAPAVVTLTPDVVTDFRNVFETGQAAFAFQNSDTVPLEKGMIVTLDNTVEGGVRRCKGSELPVGVVRSEYITVGALGQIDTRPGNYAEIKCDEHAVGVGDALVVGATAGLAEPGGGLAAGLALTPKANGIIANVKSLLTIFSRIPYQNAWYIVDGVYEDQVIAAYCFVGRKSVAEALLNVNNGMELPLTIMNDSVLWDRDTGFYYPNYAYARLNNEVLSSELSTGMAAKILSAAFGYKVQSSSASYCGGITISLNKALVLRAVSGGASRPCMFSSNGTVTRHSSQTETHGVLGGTWDSSPKIYSNGVDTTVNTTSVDYGGGRGPDGGGVGQITPNTADTVPFYMNAVAFYSVKLTAAQHLKLSNNITALGGID